MDSQQELKKRVADLEKQVAVLKGSSFGPMRGIRKRASWSIAGIPAYDIAVGPDPEQGEMRGHARGIVAIGDLATGVVALGGLARGIVAVGGLAAGLLTFGGLSIGALAAVGGLAIGSLAFGGGAVGGVAVGGGAAGYYACGGGAIGKHVVDARHQDPEAADLMRQLGLGGVCRTRR